MISRSRTTFLLAVLVTAVAPVLWGTTYWVTTEALPEDRPLLGAVLRALPIGLLMAAVLRARPAGIWWLRAFVLGALNIGAFFALLFVAAYRLPGGAASTITALQPIFALGLAALWLSVVPTRTQVAAAVVGVAGVFLVIGGGTELDGVGVGAALAAAISMGAGVVLTKRWRPPVSPVVMTSWQLTAGGLLLLPFALVFEGLPPSLDGTAIAGYAYLGIFGTGLAYVLWVRGIGRLPVASVSILSLLSPLTATTVDWVVLSRPLTGSQLIGAALIVAGVAAAQLAARPPASVAPAQPLRPVPAPGLLARRAA